MDDESLNLFPGCFEGVSNAEEEINVHADSQNDNDPSWNTSELVELITLIVCELAETHDHHVDYSEQYSKRNVDVIVLEIGVVDGPSP